MEKTKLFLQIKEIVTPFSKAKEAVANATPTSRFVEDFQINSARLIDIILAIEDAFDIEISDEQADSILTMEDAVTLVSSQLEKSTA